MRNYIVFFVASLCLASCNLFESKDDKVKIARVGEEYLYLSDLDNFSGDDAEDSTIQAEAYIDSWVKEQLLLQKALVNLTEEQSNFEEQLKNYKNSLLIYAFENQLIRQKLDTLVSDSEFKEYYENYKQNFKLKDDLVNAKFVQFLNSAPRQDSLRYWMFREEEHANEYLAEYCTQFALSCQLDEALWVPFTKIKELSQLSTDKNLYLSKGKNEIADSLQTILLDVYELRKEGDIAPLSYVKEQIRSIILNKRKTQLISKAKEEIFEDAILKEQYEIFE